MNRLLCLLVTLLIAEELLLEKCHCTSHRNEPGALLVALTNQLVYYQVSQDSATLTGNFISLTNLDTSSLVVDISYHYNNNQLYISFSNGSLLRYTLNVNSSNDLSLSVINIETLYSSLGGGLSDVAVDWVYDALYWVVRDGGNSRIYRGSLSGGGTPQEVGASVSGNISSLTVDPIYGYVYWILNQQLMRGPLSLLQTATNTTNLLSSVTTLFGSGALQFSLDISNGTFYLTRNINGGYNLIIVDVVTNNIVRTRTNVVLEPSGLSSFTDYIAYTTTDNSVMNIFFFREQGQSIKQVQSNVVTIDMFWISFQPLPVPYSSPTNISVQVDTNTANISWDISNNPDFGPDGYTSWNYTVTYSVQGTSQNMTMFTNSSWILLSSLTSGAVYDVRIEATGPGGGGARTSDTIVFVTKLPSGEPDLLIAGDQGLIRASSQNSSDTMYVSRVETDGSNDGVYNSLRNIYYLVRSTLQTSSLVVVESNGTPRTVLSGSTNRPYSLQLDWISRRLYWVESSRSIVSMSTVSVSNTNNERTTFHEENTTITDMAMDSINGILFWSTGSVIRGRTLNGLKTITCITLSYQPAAITIDPLNKRLYYINVSSSAVTTIGVISYTHSMCDSDSHAVQTISSSQLPFSSSSLLSLAYGANSLYITERLMTVVYSLPAGIRNDGVTRYPVVQVLSVNPSSFSSGKFEAISVIYPQIQPLPDGLSISDTGNISLLMPPLPGQPLLDERGSNQTFINISWTPSNYSFSPVVYQLYLNLTHLDNTNEERNVTVSTNSYAVTDQSPSTYVQSFIISYSYWGRSAEVVTNNFFSPPRSPEQVRNVKVMTYSPLRGQPEILSGLVVWDGLSRIEAGGVVDNYYINISNATSGELITYQVLLGGGAPASHAYIGPPFSVPGNTTEFSLTVSGITNFEFFILKANQSYNVQVFAGNSEGNGSASEVVTFFTNGTNSQPSELVILSSSGSGYLMTGDTNRTLSGITPPIAFDSLQRTIYYYNSNDNSVYSVSLDVQGQSKLLVKLPSNFIPLSFTYDWIAQTLYIAGNNTGKAVLMTVFRLYSQSLRVIYTSPNEEVTTGTSMGLAIDPFNGVLYWTQGDSSTSRLSSYNITSNNLSVVLSHSRNKRAVNINDVSPSGGAIVWDSVTERVWLCDTSSSDILSCDLGGVVGCRTEINNTMVMESLGNDGGLPCTTLALDESRIYWSNSLLTYYVSRDDRTSIMSFVLSGSNSIIIPTSPGLQQFPFSGEFMSNSIRRGDACLSPNFSVSANRPVVTVVTRTNTTANITWTVNNMLEEVCSSRVVSRLPLTYRVSLEISEDPLPGYPLGPIFIQNFTLTGLNPYTNYGVSVEARNQYTVVSGSVFGTEIHFITQEGVPDSVRGIQVIPFGPRHIYMSWSDLNMAQLKGNLNNKTFTILINAQQLVNERTPNTNRTIISNLLQPNTEHNFGVIVSNGVLNSPNTNIVSGRTWPLPPLASVRDITNSSMIVNITLEQIHSVLDSIRLCINSSCSQWYNVTNYTLPVTLTHNFTGLHPYTYYTVMSMGQYMAVTSPYLQAENETRMGPVIRSLAGIPDTPVLSISGDVLNWTIPDSNGPSLSFIVSITSNTTADSETFNSNEHTYNLNTYRDNNGDPLIDNIPYEIYVIARNMIGDSERSNLLTYTPTPTVSPTDNPIVKFLQSTGFIAGASAVVAAVLIILILFICVCFCCCCLNGRKDSHTFRPDYELRGLRALNSRLQSASNPHYLWSRDNFSCTDEDLELLNKFPRNKLRLENFIDRGEFGEVYQGTAVDILGQGTGPTPVAVKTMRKGASDEEQRKFLSEAALMSNFNHLNIVKVLGVCLDNDPIYIIMELMPGGDLLKFLREAKRDHGPPLLTLTELVQLALDVAQGCRYLEQQHFIHRDIAARNCLVSSKGADRVIKIGDFGLAKDLYSSDYYQVEGQRKLPVRWMAPEALNQGKFSIESDVWSFGILLWEIMTFGNQPYPGRTNQEVLQFVTGDGRLDKPENCPTRLYKLMQCCWKKYASERPNFAQIVEVISNFWDHLNNKRDSYTSEDDQYEEIEDVLQRKPSRPSRTSSVRSAFGNLARQGSMRIRNSFRRRGSLHRKEEIESQNHAGLNSEEDLIGDDQFRERGPF